MKTKTRYEVFKKSTLTGQNYSPKFLCDFENLKEAKEYCKKRLEYQKSDYVMLDTLLVCEVTYKPVFEIENQISITTSEKDL